MKRSVFSLLVVMCLASFAFADIPKPDKPQKPSTSIDTLLYIKIDGKAKEAKLIIPRSQLAQLRAELDAIDGGQDATAGVTFTSVQTIISGGLLSLAFVFGGLWFASRSGAKHAKTVAAAVVVLAVGSIATFVYGNAGPPSEARSITGRMFTQAVHMYKQGSGKIKLEVSDEVRTPELVVPDPPRNGSDNEE